MKIIIIAAGSGKRLGENTKNLPKYLIKVNEKTIMENQLEIFKKIPHKEIIVITGPHKEKFTLNDVTYVEDKHYPQHDILGSLMEAREHILGEVLIVYSDIIFDGDVFSKIANAKSDIAIAVDMNWEKAYEGRTQHPKSEAENVLIVNNKTSKIKKNITDRNNVGEFLGILKLSAKGTEIFVKTFLELEQNHQGRFHDAPSLQRAYLTDMIQELVDAGIDVIPIMINGKWCEIDTSEDLKRASQLFN